MCQLLAFASAIGPEKVKEVRFLALEYQVKIFNAIGNGYSSAARGGLATLELFENPEKLIFILHNEDFSSNNINSKKVANCAIET